MTSTDKVRHLEEDRLSMISRMSEQVADIPKKDISEMKSYSNPPTCVKDILVAVLIILGEQNTVSDFKLCFLAIFLKQSLFNS